MTFANRHEAALMLVPKLAKFRPLRPLILAIPRGAVPMGWTIADALDADLDVILVRKLGAPYAPELAIGSIDERGAVYLDPSMRDLYALPHLVEEEHRQLVALRERRRTYGGPFAPNDLTGRTAIVLDDGVATGSTMIGALRATRDRKPAWLVAATAVAPPEALRLLSREADEIICLETPDVVDAVGSYFEDFSAVTDAEVRGILRANVTSRVREGSRT